METLNPKGQGKTSPSTDAVPCCLPKEDRDRSTCDSSNGGSKDEHPTQCLTWGIDGRDDPKLDNQDSAT